MCGIERGSHTVGKLTELRVKNAKPGVHGDGGGLYLRVKPSGSKSWVLRVQHLGRREDIGLGGYPVVTLGSARDKALTLRRAAKEGENARVIRDQKRIRVPDFSETVEAAHAELSKGWAKKNGDAFKSSLTTHVIPKIGNLRVDRIGAEQIISTLSPLWMIKPELSRKLRIRIMQVLSYAKARGWRIDPLPAPAELKAGLATQPRGKNYAAMPYQRVPGFLTGQWAKEDTAGRLALLFVIFTAARSGEVRQARWNQVDEQERKWTRPAEMMKTRTQHVVTLNGPALLILERARRLPAAEGLIFPSRTGRVLSDMTLTKVLRDAGVASATVHGFRSSFRDWAAECMTTVPPMVAEMALAHTVGTRTEQAYLRSDLRSMRQALMDEWGRFAAPFLSYEGR